MSFDSQLQLAQANALGHSCFSSVSVTYFTPKCLVLLSSLSEKKQEIKPFITVILILLWVAAASALILLPAIFVTLEKMGISAVSDSNVMARKLGLIMDKKADIDVLDAVISDDVKDAW